MKMKKLGSLMMVGVLVGTMLVGCGKGSSSETKDAKKEIYNKYLKNLATNVAKM